MDGNTALKDYGMRLLNVCLTVAASAATGAALGFLTYPVAGSSGAATFPLAFGAAALIAGGNRYGLFRLRGDEVVMFLEGDVTSETRESTATLAALPGAALSSVVISGMIVDAMNVPSWIGGLAFAAITATLLTIMTEDGSIAASFNRSVIAAVALLVVAGYFFMPAGGGAPSASGL